MSIQNFIPPKAVGEGRVASDGDDSGCVGMARPKGGALTAPMVGAAPLEGVGPGAHQYVKTSPRLLSTPPG